MARVRFLTDEHVPKAVAKGLRERGIDAVTMAEVGTLGAEDPWLLERATAEGRVVITNDADYLTARRRNPTRGHRVRAG